MDDGDTALVLAARGGDKGAFATLLDRHRPMLLALCRRALGDHESAEEAAQEAALQALLNLDRLRRADRFGPWLGGIGLNVCRWRLRERTRDCWSWEALHGGRLLDEPVDGHAGPEELAVAAELAARVRRAVAELPPGQRAAVLLFYLSGLSHAETAAQLGIEPGAVKTRLHNARATLRRRLRAIWKGEDMATVVQAEPVEMRVVDVRRRPSDSDPRSTHMVVLEEVGGTRHLCIWVGDFEGTAIALALEQVETPRPLTFSFTANLLRAVGGRLREVLINRLAEETFYAVAALDGPGGAMAVDARPSDALNLALLTGAPIRVAPDVIAAAEEHSRKWHEGASGAAEIVAELKARWTDKPVHR